MKAFLTTLFITGVLFVASAQAQAQAQKDCEAKLVKPNRKTVVNGTIFILNENLKSLTSTGSTQSTDLLNIYNDLTAVLGGGHRVPPKSTIKALNRVKKKESITYIEVVLLDENRKETEVRGVMHWWDLYTNAKMESATEGTEVTKKVSEVLKFPNKFSAENLTNGLSSHGREMPTQPSQWVWLGNLPRVMSPKSVGQVKQILRLPKALNDHDEGLVEVQTADGKTQQNQMWRTSLLTDKEVAEFLKFYKLN